MADPDLLGRGTNVGKERDLGKEWGQAVGVGRLVVDTLRERTESPKYRVNRYEFPMLNREGFPSESISIVTIAPTEVPSEESVRQVKGASIILAVEAAAQIVEAGRKALANRTDVQDLQDSGNWKDEKVVKWTKEMFGKANARLSKKIEAIEAYHGR